MQTATEIALKRKGIDRSARHPSRHLDRHQGYGIFIGAKTSEDFSS